jgi:phenylpyruvate tautomerase PptA (4-oxalocrotonate tautomerase family)
MTFIHVMTPQGRLTADQRRVLAKTLTDAVLVPEVGKLTPEARRGYQVHFAERPLDMVAHGGELLSDKPSDVMLLDVVVMDRCWTREDRATVIRNIHSALAEACGMKAPSPGWWINFRIIERQLGLARRRAVVPRPARTRRIALFAGTHCCDPHRACRQIRAITARQHFETSRRGNEHHECRRNSPHSDA